MIPPHASQGTHHSLRCRPCTSDSHESPDEALQRAETLEPCAFELRVSFELLMNERKNCFVPLHSSEDSIPVGAVEPVRNSEYSLAWVDDYPGVS